MPLKPGERYLPAEVDIMHHLKHSSVRIANYECFRKTYTNDSAIRAASCMTVYKFNVLPPINTLGFITGEVTLRDYGSLDRALDYEKGLRYLSIGALRYGLCYFAENQHWRKVPRTFLFDINPCNIGKYETTKNNFRLLHEEFDKLVARANPVDPFRRKYIIVPVYCNFEGYVTVIVNPYALVKPSREREPEVCDVFHIGPATTTLDRMAGMEYYKQVVIPKIKLILRKFFDMFGPTEGYREYHEHVMKEREILLPTMPREERSFQMLWVLKKVMCGKYDLDEAIHMMIDIQETPVPIALSEMETVRQNLWITLEYAIKKVGDRAVTHILQHRQRCINHEEQHPFENEPEWLKEEVERLSKRLKAKRARVREKTRDLIREQVEREWAARKARKAAEREAGQVADSDDSDSE